MLINFFDCEYSECWEENLEDGDYYWVYQCTHPNTKDHCCELENKWCDDKDNCRLLDNIK